MIKLIIFLSNNEFGCVRAGAVLGLELETARVRWQLRVRRIGFPARRLAWSLVHSWRHHHHQTDRLSRLISKPNFHSFPCFHSVVFARLTGGVSTRTNSFILGLAWWTVIPFDSSWNVLSEIFWVQLDPVVRSTAIFQKRTRKMARIFRVSSIRSRLLNERSSSIHFNWFIFHFSLIGTREWRLAKTLIMWLAKEIDTSSLLIHFNLNIFCLF